MTFVNGTSQQIWLAASPDKDHPMATTGWELPVGQQVSVAVPNGWSGRFWGRTGCVFDASGKGRCETGDCSGELQCPGSGKTPATLAEFSLDAWNGLDFYDVSLVDGSNLPMYINIAKGDTKDPMTANGCSAAGCTKPVACPTAMRDVVDGAVVGCKNACDTFGTDDYCCRGAWSGRDNCDPTKWPVNYTLVFKNAEPYAYSYPFDDQSSMMACEGGCDFRVTFGVTPGG